MEHTLLSDYGNGFFHSDAETSMPTPFNCKEFNEEMSADDLVFESGIYPAIIPAGKRKPLKFIPGIEKSIAKLAIALAHKEYKGYCGFGFDKKGNFWAECYDCKASDYNQKVMIKNTDFTKDNHVVVKISGTGSVQAMCIEDRRKTSRFTLQTKRNQAGVNSASTLMFAIAALQYASADIDHLEHQVGVSLVHYVNELAKMVQNKSYTNQELATVTRAAATDIYSMVAYPEKVEEQYGNLGFDNSNFLKQFIPLEFEEVQKAEFDEGSIYGSFAHVGKDLSHEQELEEKPKSSKTIKELADFGEFSFGEEWSDDEMSLVPKYVDVVPSAEVIRTAKEIKYSSSSKNKTRFVLFRGESGCGKSMGAEMVAQLLHKPMLSMCISTDMLRGDLLLNCMPTQKKIPLNTFVDCVNKLPKLVDSVLNPVNSYEKITGVAKLDATPDDVFKAAFNKIYKLMSDIVTSQNELSYYDSPLLEGLRKGYVVEVQEFNTGKAGIIKALNEVMDPNGLIHLPNGETVKRHPDAVIIFTCNEGEGYKGIEEISDDFLARIQHCEQFELPDEDELAKRVAYNSQLADVVLIKKLVQAYNAVRESAEVARGSSGLVSPRQLYLWADKIARGMTPEKAAECTIVNLFGDPDARESIRDVIKNANLEV